MELLLMQGAYKGIFSPRVPGKPSTPHIRETDVDSCWGRGRRAGVKKIINSDQSGKTREAIPEEVPRAGGQGLETLEDKLDRGRGWKRGG